MTDLKGRQHDTIAAEHFDKLYAHDNDPWAYQTSPFEAEKRARTIDALGGRQFDKGLEIGCSIGILTAQLAPFCASLLGVDSSKAACDLARQHLSELRNVNVLQARIPDDLDQLRDLGEYDLIVLSEVLYFFSSSDLTHLSAYVAQSLKAGGLCVVVNFDGDTQAGFSGLEAAALFSDLTRDSLQVTHCQTYTGFQVMTFEKRLNASALS